MSRWAYNSSASFGTDGVVFIAHLSASGSDPASIVSTVSAVAYFHKINGFHDPSNCFMVYKLLAGARNLGTVPPACHTPCTQSLSAGFTHRVCISV